MLKAKILDVRGFEFAIRGTRNSRNSGNKSDTKDGGVGQNDLKLMKRLFDRGTEHRKYARMINVWLDIDAPLYWWKEFDTYKIGTVASSCSTMYTLHTRDLTVDDFSIEHLSVASMAVLNLTIEAMNACRQRFIQDGDKEDWQQMIQLLPTSYNQKRTVMMNYEVVARIIQQRSHHKLEEWHQLIDVLKKLPYVEDLIK